MGMFKEERVHLIFVDLFIEVVHENTKTLNNFLCHGSSVIG
jgi:hypothetical protein